MRVDGMDEATRFSRRSVLLGGLAAGAALAAGGVIAGCGDDDGGSSNAQEGGSSGAGTPKKGGRLIAGLIGGGTSETIDAAKGANNVDFTRQMALYDRLHVFNREGTGFDPRLAEEVSFNDTLETWTIRLVDGVEFHHGKTLDADDVRFTLERLGGPESQAPPIFKLIDPQSFKKRDARTLEFKLTSPNYTLYDLLAYYKAHIVPVDYDPARPVGTGPFKFESFTPGEQSTFSRFDNYFRGAANVDDIVIQSFPDYDSLVNAFLSGQINMLSGIPGNQTEALKSRTDVTLLEMNGGGTWSPIVMKTDTKPFDDVRVREAMRLIANRQQLVDQTMSGEGQILNDIPLHFGDVGYPDVPQREQDIDKAKSLLRQAGVEDLTLELVVAPLVPFTEPMAEVYAEQASAAGVNISVTKVDTGEFYGDAFLTRPFTTDYWSGQTYLMQAAAFLLPDAVYNETAWSDEEWNSIVADAVKEPDAGKRGDLLLEAQRIDHERGGYIIWGVETGRDAVSSKVKGFKEGKTNPYQEFDLGEFASLWLD